MSTKIEQEMLKSVKESEDVRQLASTGAEDKGEGGRQQKDANATESETNLLDCTNSDYEQHQAHSNDQSRQASDLTVTNQESEHMEQCFMAPQEVPAMLEPNSVVEKHRAISIREEHGVLKPDSVVEKDQAIDISEEHGVFEPAIREEQATKLTKGGLANIPMNLLVLPG